MEILQFVDFVESHQHFTPQQSTHSPQYCEILTESRLWGIK